MNKLSLDLADNADLRAALQGRQPGDRGTIEVDFMVTDNGSETFEADIEAVRVKGGFDGESEDEEIAPEPDTPVMIVMTERIKSSRKEPKKEKEDGKASQY